MLYDRIVETRLRSVFASLNAGDPRPMLRSLAAEFVYRFEGDTALGGERRTLDAMERWWARFFRLLPGARFEVRRVLVAGPPWATRIAVELTVRAPASAGSPDYVNAVMQSADMRWGRLTRVHTLEDTLALRRRLERLAAAGLDEALAPPILDGA